ncbi:protein-glutamine gamma-glutamyltransferase 2 isoform X2 [Chiloscyllium plagiosum]|uniref:protein-glutamine gamma-glutamyltransferase 2 isoform X2 n=1 Tax=Chiloscyllium plagiosum TaxID=36176 RepID=UPI001CB7B957|nr:protein-glutamine gamma-glutamyltransferase 2 isoform X2 [Chiloscyllium plagiosum]
MATNDIYLGAVDLQCETNNTEHHTIEIEKDRLLVRRGQEFRLRVEFRERTYLEGEDQLAMFVHTGPAPSEADGTRIQVLHSKLKRGKWTFCLQATPGYVHLAVQSPPNACTGHYQIYLVLYPSGGASIQQITAGDFHLLFNPWCQEDAVYLPDEDLLQEYILNENGLLYHGSYTNIYTLPWNFGQFEKDVIDICFQILDNSLSALKDSLADVARRNDPVYVSRIVTAMVNANDDKGVLLGRWDGNYADGIAPTRWTGSLQILRQWSGSGAEKVRYGQCWVFAAVACTVLRCLGIPSRCITNYSSAHDTDGNLKVDQYYSSEDYSRIPSKRKDMVWNYHCWLEVWMTRPDLPPGYDGWQVLDPTPQERSDGIYCCGPCPVKAIKEGHVDVKYDAAFIFAEVNADVVYWLVNKDGSKQELGVKYHQVGKQIITKSAYTDEREDLTHDYKYPEGSTKEREVYSKAGMKIRSANIQENDLRISIKYAQPILGSDFDIYFSIVNNGFMDKDIHLTLSATTITYNGFILTQFSKRSTTFTLKAATVQKEVLRLKYRDYGEHLSEHNLIRMTAVLIPKGTSEVSLKECDIALNLPRLTVKVIGEPILHRELTVQIKFANPLPITLTDGIFSVEGTGLTHLQEIKSPTTAIHPGQEVVVNVSFTPNKTGLRKLMVDFDSSRLHDVKGSTKIIVRRA